MSVRHHALLALCAILLISGCGGIRTRSQPISRSQALAMTEVVELRVVKVWDVVADSFDHDREPQVSHYIDVDVLSGPQGGGQWTLPYDEWNAGRPPVAGATVTLAPADWVRRTNNSRGRPFGGW